MIIVLGASGQLGSCLKQVNTDEQVVFLSSSDLNITEGAKLNDYFSKLPTNSTIINCAAYTAVDNAEDDKEKAYLINHIAVKSIATTCKEYGHKLIHISTDYVFSGKAYSHYNENDPTNPNSVYGSSKLAGEKEIEEICPTYLIIRTSWLYSEHAANFTKSILRLSKERDQLGIVSDQIGSPTYAVDLANTILNIVPKFQNGTQEVLHFSNEGVASWYDFAKEIVELSKSDCKVKPIETDDYPTKAKRPAFSVLNKKKIKNLFGIEIPHWKESLRVCIKNLS